MNKYDKPKTTWSLDLGLTFYVHLHTSHDFLFSLATDKNASFLLLHLRLKIFVGEPEDGRGPVLVTVSKLGQIKIEPSHASVHNGILRP